MVRNHNAVLTGLFFRSVTSASGRVSASAGSSCGRSLSARSSSSSQARSRRPFATRRSPSSSSSSRPRSSFVASAGQGAGDGAGTYLRTKGAGASSDEFAGPRVRGRKRCFGVRSSATSNGRPGDRRDTTPDTGADGQADRFPAGADGLESTFPADEARSGAGGEFFPRADDVVRLRRRNGLRTALPP